MAKGIVNKNNAYIRLHAAILLAGGTGIFGRLISIGELPLVCIRVVLGALFLAVIMGANKRLHRLPKEHLLKIAACGVLLSVHWVFYYGSIKAANVSIGAVCFALVGFFTAIIEPIVNKHRPSWRELLLSMITVAGIMLIFGFDARYRLGIGIGCLSSLVYTFFSVGSKRVQASTGHSSSTMLLYELIGGGVVLTLATPLYALVFPETPIVPTLKDWGFLLLFSSVFTVLLFLMHLQALRSISAFTVNLSYNLEPVYTILLAMIIFNEASELNRSFWIGIFMIVLSVVLQTISSKKQK